MESPPPRSGRNFIFVTTEVVLETIVFEASTKSSFLGNSKVYIYERLDGRLYMGAFIWELLYVYKAARIEKLL